MTILCVGDSHVKRFGAFLDSQASADVFKIADLPQVNFFGISGGAVTNPRHLQTILAVIDEHRPTCLIVHMGGNDLDSRDNAIDTVVFGLTAFLTQIRVQFHIPHITVMRFMPRERTRNINPETYNERVVLANTKLKFQCQQVGLVYWRLKGFTNSREQIFADGVHLNSLGMRKYFRQFRGIFLSFLHNNNTHAY